MTTWTDQNEAVGPGGEFYFLIDDNFFFLIDDVYKLIIDTDSGTIWTDQNEA